MNDWLVEENKALRELVQELTNKLQMIDAYLDMYQKGE